MSIRIQFVTTTGHTFPTTNYCSFFLKAKLCSPNRLVTRECRQNIVSGKFLGLRRGLIRIQHKSKYIIYFSFSRYTPENMTRFQELLLNVSLFLSMVTLIKARITVNKCQDSSPKASCRQQCYEDCKMSCGQADPQLKSCEQTCLDHGSCDLKCVTKGTCHQDCESLPTCGSLFCKTADCTQRCDEGMCNMSCRATSHCKQLCKAGSCHLKCAKTSERCKQVSMGAL